jgi:hypothetical protein
MSSEMDRWTRAGVVVLAIAGSTWGSAWAGQRSGQAEPQEVKVVNEADEPVPVRGEIVRIREPLVLDDRTTVALKAGTAVEIVPPTWQYREVRVPTSPGSAASVVGALNAAGADGWETTGLSFSSPGATIVVMKRQVTGGR